MDLNQVIYTVFRGEFESGSRIGPKPPQDPIFKDFLKIMIFIKIRFLSIFIGSAAVAEASKFLVKCDENRNFVRIESL